MKVINDTVAILWGHSLSTNESLARCAPFGYSVYHGWLGLVNTITHELMWQTSFCDSVNVSIIGLMYDSESRSVYVLVSGGVSGDFESAAVIGASKNTYLFKYEIINTTGINEPVETNGELSLYPNPTNNNCMLKIETPYEMRKAVVLDAVGKQVLTLFNDQKLRSFNFNCNILSSGLYFLKVMDSQAKIQVVKLIKE